MFRIKQRKLSAFLKIKIALKNNNTVGFLWEMSIALTIITFNLNTIYLPSSDDHKRITYEILWLLLELHHCFHSTISFFMHSLKNNIYSTLTFLSEWMIDDLRNSYTQKRTRKPQYQNSFHLSTAHQNTPSNLAWLLQLYKIQARRPSRSVSQPLCEINTAVEKL